MRSVKFRRVAKELFDDNGLRAHGCNPRNQNADHVFAAQIACMGKIAWVGTHGWAHMGGTDYVSRKVS
jgi:hypothetical protein